ncbi:hypothetical protein C7Y66_26045 [Chroococcidiopsis sp. CCALA 051]|uniref:type IV pilus modification PilV family protein n=1 Tax=Chroococcidiopsis sp. CCALA 051 TaxID=869949 RepID=UPI000D0DCE5A|nr:prepilin-type N-terminal cleavage/methylation domain-containing protein [Chroococcidiopsis sp. CCALA 051]PSM46243.1 hypothetical protein C7Y66_26045 [Chroococcidiopsis sp. CCALA 051]
MFKAKLLKQEQGFTIIEVLIAILIAIVFVTVAMQMMVMAAMFKVRAQESVEATAWIQEDLENVKYQAANYQYAQLKDEASGDDKHEFTDTILHVSSVDNFSVGNNLIIGNDSNNHIIQSVDSTASPPTITLTTALGTDWSTNTPVVAITKCNPGTDKSAGFADGLRDLVSGTNETADSNYVDETRNSKLFTNKSYTLRRTTTIHDISPYRVLEIKYEVSPGSTFNSTKVIASFNTEVIPNAALQCPN